MDSLKPIFVKKSIEFDEINNPTPITIPNSMAYHANAGQDSFGTWTLLCVPTNVVGFMSLFNFSDYSMFDGDLSLYIKLRTSARASFLS